MVGRKYTTTVWLPLLKLVCISFKNEVYNAGLTTRGGTPSPNFFSTKILFIYLFCYFFSVAVLLSQT